MPSGLVTDSAYQILGHLEFLDRGYKTEATFTASAGTIRVHDQVARVADTGGESDRLFDPDIVAGLTQTVGCAMDIVLVHEHTYDWLGG